MPDHDPLRLTHDVRVSLDGRDISEFVFSWSMQQALDTLHDELSMSVAPAMGDACDPDRLAGTARLHLEIDGAHRWFLLETRERGETEVALWGRSASAALDTPHALAVNEVATAPRSARDLAESWAGALPLDWQLDDWQLPADFSYAGTAAEGLAALAQTAGGICRATHLEDGGGLVIRSKWPTTPALLPDMAPALIYDRDTNLLSCSASVQQSAADATAVEIDGHQASLDLPSLEIEQEGDDGDMVRGQDVIVRGYWACDPGTVVAELLTTAGTVQDLGLGTETITERLTVEDGMASTSRPVQSLTSAVWVGRAPDTAHDAPTWSPWSTSLECAESGYGIVDVEYTTSFQRWRVHGHDVAAMLFVLLLAGVDDVRLEVSLARNAADETIADEVISEPWQTNAVLAVQRACQWLYENTYNSLQLQWTAPWEANAADGVLALVHSPESGVSTACVVTSVSTSHDGLKILQELEGVAWRS